MADTLSKRPEMVAATDGYPELLEAVRRRIESAGIRASSAVNRELVLLYWSIGREIVARQEDEGWGAAVIARLAQDLRAEGAGSRSGFSRRNLFYMRRFAALWADAEKVQTLSAQIGWSHHVELLKTFPDDRDLYAWYAAQAAEHRWSVRRLQALIHLGEHRRRGAATTNFAEALPTGDADAAQAVTKDPYVLDFATSLIPGFGERQLEQALLTDIVAFMQELGEGYCLYGRQLPLVVGDQEFVLDLVFFHHRLRRFVVIDLKIGRFKPEHVGKMNLYLNAVDDKLRHGDDGESVGIILCTGHDDTVARVALQGVRAPIGVSTYTTGVDRDLVADRTPHADDAAELTGLPADSERLEAFVARRVPQLEAKIGEGRRASGPGTLGSANPRPSSSRDSRRRRTPRAPEPRTSMQR